MFRQKLYFSMWTLAVLIQALFYWYVRRDTWEVSPPPYSLISHVMMIVWLITFLACRDMKHNGILVRHRSLTIIFCLIAAGVSILKSAIHAQQGQALFSLLGIVGLLAIIAWLVSLVEVWLYYPTE